MYLVRRLRQVLRGHELKSDICEQDSEADREFVRSKLNLEQDRMSCDLMSCDLMSCDLMSCDLMSCDLMSCDLISCDLMSCDLVELPLYLFQQMVT